MAGATTKGPRSQAPPLTITGTLGAKPHEGCWLCSLPHTDLTLIELYATRTITSPKQRKAAVRRVIEETGARTSAEQVQEHFQRHQAIQPTPNWNWLRDHYERYVAQLKPIHNEILELVSRAGLVTVEQVADVFFPHTKGQGRKARLDNAQWHLRHLTARHFLYRVHGYGMGRKSWNSVFFLGRAGAELLLADGHTHVASWTGSPENVGMMTLRHDVGVGDVWRDIDARTGQVELLGTVATVTAPHQNYWAARSLSLALGTDGLVIDKEVLRPDGLMMIQVELENPPQGVPARFSMPLLEEWDTGARNTLEAVEQLAAYVALARSGALGKRFPALAVKGYATPVLMVTRSATNPANGELAKGRAERIGQRTLERLRKLGIARDDVALLVATRQDVAEHGLNIDVFDVRAQEWRVALPTIMAASQKLIETKQLDATQTLQIDPAAARQKRKVIGKRRQKSASRLRGSRQAQPAQPVEKTRAPQPQPIAAESAPAASPQRSAAPTRKAVPLPSAEVSS